METAWNLNTQLTKIFLTNTVCFRKEGKQNKTIQQGGVGRHQAMAWQAVDPPVKPFCCFHHLPWQHRKALELAWPPSCLTVTHLLTVPICGLLRLCVPTWQFAIPKEECPLPHAQCEGGQLFHFALSSVCLSCFFLIPATPNPRHGSHGSHHPRTWPSQVPGPL